MVNDFTGFEAACDFTHDWKHPVGVPRDGVRWFDLKLFWQMTA